MDEVKNSYVVIIDSIGKASPIISKFLSDSFNLNQEIILHLLYRTPSVLFYNINKEIADNAKELLTKLGLEIKIVTSDQPLPEIPELIDIAIYLPDPLQLPNVNKQISEFLGCAEQESFNLFLDKPSW